MTDPKAEIARLRWEARHFRDFAKARRAELRQLRALPMGRRDPIRALECQTRIGEYTLAAQQRDRLAKEIRATLRGAQ